MVTVVQVYVCFVLDIFHSRHLSTTDMERERERIREWCEECVQAKTGKVWTRIPKTINCGQECDKLDCPAKPECNKSLLAFYKYSHQHTHTLTISNRHNVHPLRRNANGIFAISKVCDSQLFEWQSAFDRPTHPKYNHPLTHTATSKRQMKESTIRASR